MYCTYVHAYLHKLKGVGACFQLRPQNFIANVDLLALVAGV